MKAGYSDSKFSIRMAGKIVYVQNLGRMRYMPAWDYQKMIAEKVQKNVKSGKEPCHTLLLVEHEPGEDLLLFVVWL